jgi:hypothetical protein
MERAKDWLNKVLDAAGAPQAVQRRQDTVHSFPVRVAQAVPVPDVYRDATGGIKMSPAFARAVLDLLVEGEREYICPGVTYNDETVALAAALDVNLEDV